MCVGLAAKVEKINGGIATVNATGARREVNVEMISGLKVGDYVMLHAGIAIARITEDEAVETQNIMSELYELLNS